MASTADGIVYPIASDFIAPLNTHLQSLAESVQTALDGRAPTALTTYTPTLTGVTLGNGSVVAKYCKVGGIIVDEIVVTFGTTTSITGEVTISGLEPSSNNSAFFTGQASLYDSGSAYYIGAVRQASTTSLIVNAQNSSGTYLVATALSATIPHTWAVSDQIIVKTVRLAA